MYYFVIAADGQKYGPVDVDALVQWAAEGRLVPTTTLIERGTERQMRADSLDALSAAFQRVSSRGPGVVVERHPSSTGEAPTLTRGPGPAGPTIPPMPMAPAPPYAESYGQVGPKSKIVAGLLGILLPFGIHRFYLGYIGIGILQLVTCCFGGSIWCIVEGIICLCGGMRDADGRELCD